MTGTDAKKSEYEVKAILQVRGRVRVKATGPTDSFVVCEQEALEAWELDEEYQVTRVESTEGLC